MDETPTTLTDMFKRQHQLQVDSFSINPCALDGEDVVTFIRWNVLALENELHEALDEVNWKPWAKSPREIRDVEAFRKELVDAFHFLMNLVLTTGSTPEDAVDAFMCQYFEKADVNAQRQADGYTGLDKCPNCHRDFNEVNIIRETNGSCVCAGCGHCWRATA